MIKEIKFKDIEPRNRMYSVGEVLSIENENFLIVHVGQSKCCIIDLATGRSINPPIQVEDANNIKQQEMNKLSSRLTNKEFMEKMYEK